MQRVIFPCKDCADRTLGCHSTCEKYNNIKQQANKQNQEIRDARNFENSVTSLDVARHIRKNENKRNTNLSKFSKTYKST